MFVVSEGYEMRMPQMVSRPFEEVEVAN